MTTSFKMTLLLGLIMVQYLVFKRRPMKTVLSFLAHNGACPKVVALQKSEIFCYSIYYPYRCNISVRLVLFPFFTTLTFFAGHPLCSLSFCGKIALYVNMQLKLALSIHTLSKWYFLLFSYTIHRLFLDISKKTQTQKTQNSRKILKKLKRNSEKTQKPAIPVELSWC